MPLNIDWQQILLHLLNFIILAGGLYLLLYKPVKNFMEKRTEYYRGMDEDARRHLSEAEDLKAEREKLVENAESEIAALRAEAKREAEELASRRIAAAEEKSRRIIADAKESAAAEREQIISEARHEVTEIAVSAAKKMLSESSSSVIDDFLDAAEKE